MTFLWRLNFLVFKVLDNLFCLFSGFLRFSGSLTPFSGFSRFLRLPGSASHPVIIVINCLSWVIITEKIWENNMDNRLLIGASILEKSILRTWGLLTYKSLEKLLKPFLEKCILFLKFFYSRFKIYFLPNSKLNT